MAIDWNICLNLVYCQGQGYVNFDSKYRANGNRENITIVIKYEIPYWLAIERAVIAQ